MLLRENGIQIPLAAAPEGKNLGFGGAPAAPLYAQQHSNWCWAACIQMVGDARPNPLGLDQALIVRTVKGSPCRLTTPGGLCNDPATVQEIDRGYVNHGIPAISTWSQITSTALSAALTGGKPVEIGWRGAGVGHVVLVIDEQPSAQGTLFTVNDPKPAIVTLTYSELQTPATAYPTGVWVATWTF